MKAVFIIEGWFGDIEWTEGVYSDKEKAYAVCNSLWAERRSDVLPRNHFAQGFCKFAVVEHEVIR